MDEVNAGPTRRAPMTSDAARERVGRAREQARDLTQQLASSAENVAATFDDIADRKDEEADNAVTEEARGRRRDAGLAREFAQNERAESRRLRDQGKLPN